MKYEDMDPNEIVKSKNMKKGDNYFTFEYNYSLRQTRLAAHLKPCKIVVEFVGDTGWQSGTFGGYTLAKNGRYVSGSSAYKTLAGAQIAYEHHVIEHIQKAVLASPFSGTVDVALSKLSECHALNDTVATFRKEIDNVFKKLFLNG